MSSRKTARARSFSKRGPRHPRSRRRCPGSVRCAVLATSRFAGDVPQPSAGFGQQSKSEGTRRNAHRIGQRAGRPTKTHQAVPGALVATRYPPPSNSRRARRQSGQKSPWAKFPLGRDRRWPTSGCPPPEGDIVACGCGLLGAEQAGEPKMSRGPVLGGPVSPKFCNGR
jgi:hypothetical protein